MCVHLTPIPTFTGRLACRLADSEVDRTPTHQPELPNAAAPLTDGGCPMPATMLLAATTLAWENQPTPASLQPEAEFEDLHGLGDQLILSWLFAHAIALQAAGGTGTGSASPATPLSCAVVGPDGRSAAKPGHTTGEPSRSSCALPSTLLLPRAVRFRMEFIRRRVAFCSSPTFCRPSPLATNSM